MIDSSRWLWLVVLTPLLLLGCTQDGGDDDDTGGQPDDDDTGDDDTGDDDTGDDDTGDDDTGDDDTGDDDTGDDDTEIPERADGYVSLSAYHMPDGMGGILNYAYFMATFSVEIQPYVAAVVPNMPAGTDDCAVTVYTAADLEGGSPGEYERQSAGPIGVTGPGASYTVPPLTDGDTVYYQQALQLGSELQFDSSYDVSAPGGDFPGFDETIVIHPDITLVSPAITDSFTVGNSLSVQWTGGSAGDLTLYLGITGNDEYGTVYCQPANDGEFTIPANAIQQLPPGMAVLSVSQYSEDFVDLGGRWLMLTGATGEYANGTLP